MPDMKRLAEAAWAEYWVHQRAIERCATTGSRRVPLELSERAADAYERATRLDKMAAGGEVS